MPPNQRSPPPWRGADYGHGLCPSYKSHTVRSLEYTGTIQDTDATDDPPNSTAHRSTPVTTHLSQVGLILRPELVPSDPESTTMSCPGRTSSTTHPAPIRVRSTAPSPEPKVRCLSPRLVDEDVVMYECEKELEPPQASVRLGVPHAIIPESASCLQFVVAEPNASACPTPPTPAEVDTRDHEDDEGEEWEEWEEEEDREIDHDLPSSTSASTGSCSLLNNRAKLAASPHPRAAPAPDPLPFERPVEVQVRPPTLAPGGPTGVKTEDESDEGDLWREPTRVPGSFLQHPDRPSSESATSGGHPKSTSERIGTGSKESSESRGTEPGRAQPQEPEGEHEISINLTTRGAETASVELHLTSSSVDASREHSAAPTSEPTFDLKVTAKGPGRFSVSAAWERGGAR